MLFSICYDVRMRFLNRLRLKSSRTKSHIAFTIALSLTGLIGVVWSSTLPVRLTEVGKGMATDMTQTSAVRNGFTDLVEETKKIMVAPEDSSGDDKIGVDPSSPHEESVLGQMRAQDGETPVFDMSTATPTVEHDTVPKTTVPTEQVSPSTTPPGSPRVILIGTTTRGAP